MWLQHLRQDIRYALRQWRRSPGFVLTAVLTLALGIGGTTAMFTLMDTVLLRDLPVARAGELYRVGDNPYAGVTSGLQNNFGIFSWDLYQFFRENTPELQELAAFQAAPRTMGIRQSGSREPAQAAVGEFVSGNYFSLFEVAPFAGRLLNSADDDLSARLTLLFGLTGLAMVALGTYGATAWSVQQRTKEIGIRMAVGANRASILALMAQESFRLLAAGVGLGLPLALAAGRMLGARLYGIGSYNLAVLANAMLALVVSAAIAVLLPATRAASMQPTVALRHE